MPMKKLLMEFLGTFFLVLAVAMNAGAIAIAAMLMTWIYIGGYVSGAHYNPLVTLAVVVRERFGWKEAPWYMLAQVLGGFVAYALTFYLKGQIVIPAPAPQVTILQAFLVEVLLSFTFALVVLVVTTTELFRTSQLFGLIIGFSIPALARVGAPISGGLFNPAIALGASLMGLVKGTPILWEHLFMYVGGAFLGAVLAAIVFKYFMTEHYKIEIIQ